MTVVFLAVVLSYFLINFSTFFFNWWNRKVHLYESYTLLSSLWLPDQISHNFELLSSLFVCGKLTKHFTSYTQDCTLCTLYTVYFTANWRDRTDQKNIMDKNRQEGSSLYVGSFVDFPMDGLSYGGRDLPVRCLLYNAWPQTDNGNIEDAHFKKIFIIYKYLNNTKFINPLNNPVSMSKLIVKLSPIICDCVV